MTTTSQRIFGLDLMRATAITCVVFSHIAWFLPVKYNYLTGICGYFGFIGVEIFFVLSGFLIGRILFKLFANQDFNLKKINYFLVRRWFRTLPNYYLILIVNIAIVVSLGNELPKKLWQFFFFLQNFAWPSELFFVESWSLPIEELSYLLAPFLLYGVLLLKLKINKQKLFIIISIIVILFFTITKIIYNFYTPISTIYQWNDNLKVVTIFRIDAIYYGLLAAGFSLIEPNVWLRLKGISFWLGVIIILGFNFSIGSQKLLVETHPFLWNVLYIPIHSIAIMLCLPLLSSIKYAPAIIKKPITVISIISYSIYLLHYSVVLQLLRYFIPTESLSNIDLILFTLCYLSITLLLSYLLYYIFEKPIMNLRDKKFITERFK